MDEGREISLETSSGASSRTRPDLLSTLVTFLLVLLVTSVLIVALVIVVVVTLAEEEVVVVNSAITLSVVLGMSVVTESVVLIMVLLVTSVLVVNPLSVVGTTVFVLARAAVLNPFPNIETVVPNKSSSGVKVLLISLAEYTITLLGLTSKFARAGIVGENPVDGVVPTVVGVEVYLMVLVVVGATSGTLVVVYNLASSS